MFRRIEHKGKLKRRIMKDDWEEYEAQILTTLPYLEAMT